MAVTCMWYLLKSCWKSISLSCSFLCLSSVLLHVEISPFLTLLLLLLISITIVLFLCVLTFSHFVFASCRLIWRTQWNLKSLWCFNIRWRHAGSCFSLSSPSRTKFLALSCLFSCLFSLTNALIDRFLMIFQTGAKQPSHFCLYWSFINCNKQIRLNPT